MLYMNKYEVITKESKKIKRESTKKSLQMLNPKNILNKASMIQNMNSILEDMVKLATYQITLDKDVYLMDDEKLNIVLNDLKIDRNHFDEQINAYDNTSYLIVDRYLNYLIESKDENLSLDEKCDKINHCANDIDNYGKTMKKNQFFPKETMMSKERIEQIDALAETIYLETIQKKITSPIKESDLIKSVYDRNK